jgi:hypothetical protein
MSTYLRSIPFLALSLCGLMVSQQASAEMKVGYVDFQKLMTEAPQVKSAMQALQNEFGPRQRELLAMQNDLKARDEKLAKEGAIMAEADRAKAEKALRDQQREFSRRAGNSRTTCRPVKMRKSARYSATCSKRSGPIRAHKVSIWCWARACSTTSRSWISPRKSWKC